MGILCYRLRKSKLIKGGEWSVLWYSKYHSGGCGDLQGQNKQTNKQKSKENS